MTYNLLSIGNKIIEMTKKTCQSLKLSIRESLPTRKTKKQVTITVEEQDLKKIRNYCKAKGKTLDQVLISKTIVSIEIEKEAAILDQIPF